MRPAELNPMIEANVIHAACKFDVEKLLFLGSPCICPKRAPQQIPENTLLTGPLEPATGIARGLWPHFVRERASAGSAGILVRDALACP